MPIYYPAVAAKLVVRFDESLLTGVTPTPTLPQANAGCIHTEPAASVNKAHSEADPGQTRRWRGASSQGALMESASNTLTHSLVIIPRTASIELPTYRQAPKFSMTFAFKDFPVDPRAIRAMGVELYIGVVSGENFARGMLGQQDGGRLASQLTINLDNLMLVGVADNITATHSEKGSEVMVDGRGLQGMLLDAKIHADTLKTLNLKQSIKGVIEDLLCKDAQGSRIPVRINPSEWPNGVPSPAGLEIISRENQGQKGGKTNLPMKGDPNQIALWDVITRYCEPVGAIPYFIANNLWIRPVRGIFEQKNADLTGDTPFAGGIPRTLELAGGKTLDVSFRKMIYGRNLLNFKLERKFGGVKVPVVQCVSVDNTKTSKDRLILGQWPPEGKKEALSSAVDPSGQQARSEPLRIPVPGIIDKDRLTAIAKQIFNEVGRGEMGGSGSTKDLASLGGDNRDADIIRLRPGDAIEFAADAGGLASIPPVVSELSNKAAMDSELLSQDIQKRMGFSKSLADVLAGTASGSFPRLQNVFRIANVRYAWDIGSGIAVDFDFQNYVTARYEFEGESQQGQLGDFAGVAENAYGSASGSA